MARAAASKAGPRFAEVAGRARWNGSGAELFVLLLLFFVLLFVLDIRVSWVGFLRLIQSSDHRVQSGVQDDGRMAECIQSSVFTVRGILKEFATMEFHGEVGILQQVSGKDEDNGFIRLHEFLLD